MKPSNNRLMSLLYDNVYGYEVAHVVINGIVYYKKPNLYVSLKRKLFWIIEILRGKAIAVHFKEDE